MTHELRQFYGVLLTGYFSLIPRNFWPRTLIVVDEYLRFGYGSYEMLGLAFILKHARIKTNRLDILVVWRMQSPNPRARIHPNTRDRYRRTPLIYEIIQIYTVADAIISKNKYPNIHVS